MIQTFTVTAPLAGADGDAATAKLTDQMSKVQHFYPALLSSTVQASETVLTMTVRVSGQTRWHTSYAARQIGSSMLRRAGIDVATATMILTDTARHGAHLTKQQGRNTGL